MKTTKVGAKKCANAKECRTKHAKDSARSEERLISAFEMAAKALDTMATSKASDSKVLSDMMAIFVPLAKLGGIGNIAVGTKYTSGRPGRKSS